MPRERWKSIEKSSNYLISDRGRVQNRRTGRILKINRSRGKFEVFIPSDEGGYVTKQIRTLVVQAFGEEQLAASGLERKPPTGRSKDVVRTWVIEPGEENKRRSYRSKRQKESDV